MMIVVTVRCVYIYIYGPVRLLIVLAIGSGSITEVQRMKILLLVSSFLLFILATLSIPRELINVYLKGFKSCEFPRYSVHDWYTKHGEKLPNHPAVFYDFNHVDNWPKELSDKDEFLNAYGRTTFYTLPEYLAAGGLLWWFNMMQVDLYPYWESYSYDTLIKNNAERPIYMQDFSCATPVCTHTFKGGPIRDISHFFRGAAAPEGDIPYIHVGSTGSGLPFHTHEHFWQGLTAGRKIWYAVPPDSMTATMHDLIGPHTFPTRAFASEAFNTLPIGDRPLMCVQHPGEVLYVPNRWWHATLNLEDFNLSFGSKLTKEPDGTTWSAVSDEMSNATASSLVNPFLYHTATDIEGTGSGVGGLHPKTLIPDQSLPLTLMSTLDVFQERMTKGDVDMAWKVMDNLEGVLIRAANISTGTRDGLDMEEELALGGAKVLSEPLAVVYCLMAKGVFPPITESAPMDWTRRRKKLVGWMRMARELSPSVYNLACGSLEDQLNTIKRSLIKKRRRVTTSSKKHLHKDEESTDL